MLLIPVRKTPGSDRGRNRPAWMVAKSKIPRAKEGMGKGGLEEE